MADSPTRPWFAVDVDALTYAVGRRAEVEGPVLDHMLAMCDTMRCCMWAWCSGVKAEVSAEWQSGTRLGAAGVDVIAGYRGRGGWGGSR